METNTPPLNSDNSTAFTFFDFETSQQDPAPVAPVVSTQLREVFELVNYVTISSAIGLFGIFTNVINIVVFIKLGFKDVINISLLALTLIDLIGLFVLEWFNICVNPYFRLAHMWPFIPSQILFVFAGWPHSCCMKITCLFTAFISVERCLCITMPLKVKTILTPKRTLVSLFVLTAIALVSFIPAYLTIDFEWQFDTWQNRTVLGARVNKDKTNIRNIAFVVNTIMQFTAFGSVAVSTIILVKKLKEKAKWRSESSSQGKGDNKASISAKDKSLVKMVILMSVILVLCCTPGTTFYILSMVEKGFSSSGQLSNLYFTAWSFAYITDALNPSVSIFIYLTMSSNYQKVFYSTFTCFSKAKQTKQEEVRR